MTDIRESDVQGENELRPTNGKTKGRMRKVPGQPEFSENRRRQVARLRLRGLTITEIAKVLPELGIINRDTGKPFSRITVFQDLQVIKEEWRKESVADADVYLGKLLGENSEIRRRIWGEAGEGSLSKDQVKGLMDSMEFEAKLRGLTRDTKVNVFTGDIHVEQEYQVAIAGTLEGLTDEQFDTIDGRVVESVEQVKIPGPADSAAGPDLPGSVGGGEETEAPRET